MGEAPEYVLVLRTLGAPERRLLQPRRRVTRDAPPRPAPEPVITSRATLVDTVGLDDEAAAQIWLRDADLEALAEDAIARLNRIVYAHRVATADPYAREVSRDRALATRVGFGVGDQVAEGRWDSARELTSGGRDGLGLRPEQAVLRPQERLAAVLAGRDAVLACEELTLRARSDVDAGRYREAALQLRVAFEAAIAELEPWRERASLPERLEELRARRHEVGAAANAALKAWMSSTSKRCAACWARSRRRCGRAPPAAFFDLRSSRDPVRRREPYRTCRRRSSSATSGWSKSAEPSCRMPSRRMTARYRALCSAVNDTSSSRPSVWNANAAAARAASVARPDPHAPCDRRQPISTAGVMGTCNVTGASPVNPMNRAVVRSSSAHSPHVTATALSRAR